MRSPPSNSETLSTGQGKSAKTSLANEADSAGLTDDQRMQREDDGAQEGVRVKLGPADLDRVKEP